MKVPASWSAKLKCDSCGGFMELRTAKQGAHAGRQFYGCIAYPACRHTLPQSVGDAILADIKRAAREAEEKAAAQRLADALATDLGFLEFLDFQ